jgi:glycosyltransferase involved in cell wall biosynthesis
MPIPLKDALKRAVRSPILRTPTYVSDEQLYQQTRDQASRHSLDVLQQIRMRKFDVLFGCCISTILCELSVDVPIVYFGDSTARVSFDTYPELRTRPKGFRRACEEIEREALKRTSIAVFATELARHSAIHDYDFPADRAYTVPMGANIVGGEEGFAPFSRDTPSRASVRLVITAADPVRKRLELAIEVVDILRRRGWAAELEQIGLPTPRALGHPHVKCLGRLSMATSSGRKRNYEALRRSHLMILPSLGEAFGIAPCEAALLGKPSIVSNVGGLPEVVLHDITGIVMRLDSTAEDYANAIIRLAEQPDRYRAMAAAAAARARANFTWERWGERLMEIMERARTAKKR